MVNIQNLIDDAKCFETVRDLRWADGIVCPHCGWDRLRIREEITVAYIWKSRYLSFPVWVKLD